MAIGPRLELRQSQNLVMTTQLQQSIKLLQLSALELSEFVATEIEQNPLLGRDDGGDNYGEELPAEAPPREAQSKTEDVVEYGESHKSWDEDTTNALDNPQDAFLENSEGGDFNPTASAQSRGLRHDNEGTGAGRDYTVNITEAPSLQDHLREQLHIEIIDPVQRIIGLHLIDLIDERGYLPEDISSICETLGCDKNEVERTLEQLQRFDPVGVGARSLSECLAIQLREKDRFDPAMEVLVKHLDVMAEGDLQKLAHLCHLEEDDIVLMCQEIRALNPKPGYRFGSDIVQAVIPDVFLRKAPDSGWQVELNSDALPKVLVNRQYYSRISETARRKEDKKYLSEQLAHANWLTKALDQRAQTILKVSTEIVRQQDAFFRKGVRFFKPLTLRDISEAVDMHESTVSRVTTQKYISTGTAIYELKYFFSSSVGSSQGGDAHSSETVKYYIKEMIDNENPKKILSDDAIAEQLQEKGIDIARRTVAKYREAMEIPSSPARRRYKKRLV
ncbi:MAG: RNA polymerase factor sigma-54 [Alphaproteobacteria bacterium]|nr:RNA polymerase factor sigma-54 [Alphaproteobacteria bacterium]